MSTVALAFRLILAVCLAVAGAAKLADPRGSREAMTGFGVPASVAGVAAVGVASVELAIAVALVPVATATVAAGAALALLVLFSGVLAVRLARGEQPDCHCFGRLGAKPATWGALVRNAGLAAAAVLVLASGPGPSALGWVGDLSPAGRVALAAGAVLAAVVAACSALVVHLLRRHGRLLLRLEEMERGRAPSGARSVLNGHLAGGLPIGVRAPRFELPATDGDRVSLDALLAGGRPVLLVFSDTRCGACEALLPRLAEWQRERRNHLVVALVSAGDHEELSRKRAAYDLDLVLRDTESDEVASAYGAGQTPAAVLVDSQGRVASRVMAGEGEIASLADELIGMRGPGPGDEAPAVDLPGAAGEPVSLRPHGEPALVVFWDPACPACGEAVAELRTWDAAPEPRLFVISRGGAAANSDLGIGAPVALDEDDAVTRAFGVRGTPAAVLVDGDGAIASPIAEGASAIRVLAAMSTRDLEGVRP